MIAKSTQKYVIGIVGGLGPFAHIQFERYLLDATIRLIDAKRDQDFPHWILSSMPQTSARTSGNSTGADSPVPALIESLKCLEAHDGGHGAAVPGADFAVMICNSAHQFLSELQERTHIPILNMIELTAKYVARTHPGARVGILATTATLESNLYHDNLRRHGLMPLSPLDLPEGENAQAEMIMAAIYGDGRGDGTGGGIKSGNLQPHHIDKLTTVAHQMIKLLDVEVLIAGCTEIPIVLPTPAINGKTLVDPMKLAAEAVISVAYGLIPWTELTWGESGGDQTKQMPVSGKPVLP